MSLHIAMRPGHLLRLHRRVSQRDGHRHSQHRHHPSHCSASACLRKSNARSPYNEVVSSAQVKVPGSLGGLALPEPSSSMECATAWPLRTSSVHHGEDSQFNRSYAATTACPRAAKQWHDPSTYEGQAMPPMSPGLPTRRRWTRRNPASEVKILHASNSNRLCHCLAVRGQAVHDPN
jgi:hypothetical protein